MWWWITALLGTEEMPFVKKPESYEKVDLYKIKYWIITVYIEGGNIWIEKSKKYGNTCTNWNALYSRKTSYNTIHLLDNRHCHDKLQFSYIFNHVFCGWIRGKSLGNRSAVNLYTRYYMYWINIQIGLIPQRALSLCWNSILLSTLASVRIFRDESMHLKMFNKAPLWRN